MAKPSKAKTAIHQLIRTNKVLREDLEKNLLAVPTPPKDETLRMAFDAGRRFRDCELMSIYKEVEDAINGHDT